MAHSQQQPVLIEAYDHEIEPPRAPAPLKQLESEPAPQRAGRAVRAKRGRAATRKTDTGYDVPMHRDVYQENGPGFDESKSHMKRRRSRTPRPRQPTKRTCLGPQSSDPKGINPIPIQIVNKAKTFVNHSYHDYSRIPRETAAKVDGYWSEGGEMSFTWKLFDILSKKEFNNFITWRPHGRAFIVLAPKCLELKVLGKYFDHCRYSTFLRQLTLYGFKHISQGRDRNCYYHEAFLRGLPHLLNFMPAPKNRRRLIADPENEPDLYRISELYPVSGNEVGKSGKVAPDFMKLSPAEKNNDSDITAAAASNCLAQVADIKADISMTQAGTASMAAAISQAAAASRAAAMPQVAVSQAAISQEAAATRAVAASQATSVLHNAAASALALIRRKEQLELTRQLLLGGPSHPLSAAGLSSTSPSLSALCFASPRMLHNSLGENYALMAPVAANASSEEHVLGSTETPSLGILRTPPERATQHIHTRYHWSK